MQAIRDAAVELFNSLGRGAQIVRDEDEYLPIAVRCGDVAYQLEDGRFVLASPAEGPAALTITAR